MEKYGVVMAGGGGTRFWPLSRQEMPKQLLNLSGKDSMINETIDRLSNVVEMKHIFVVTNKKQASTMQEAVKERICPENILSEPSARNTAACIGYAAVRLQKEHGDGIMVITPSDAYIKDTAEYARVLKKAAEIAQKEDKLVTVGIMPAFPATGYGYIKYEDDTKEARKVLEFKEKPDLETAKSYVKSKSYAWNSGIFIWKVSVILECFKEYLPDIYRDLMRIQSALFTDQEKSVMEDVYPKIRKISIDYGIMEKASGIVVIPGDFGWSDVGSFDMLGVLHKADKQGNVIIGEQINLDTRDTISYSSGKLIATIGVSDLVIVETPDAILVCDKKRAQDVKKIVEELEHTGREELL